MSLGLDGPVADTCPYLALQDDPDSHALYARQDHVCGLARKRSLDIAWQQRFCLRADFRRCPRFCAAQPPSVIKPLVVMPPRRTRPRAAVIFMTVVVLIWLTSAVCAALLVANYRGSTHGSLDLLAPFAMIRADAALPPAYYVVSR